MKRTTGVVVWSDTEAEVIGTASEAWLTWAKRHGIDPMEVPVGSPLRRNLAQRRVEFQIFERDEFGNYVTRGCDAVMRDVHVQLESEPLPWPVSD